MLGLEIPKQSQAVNLGLMVLGLGLGLTDTGCCLFERIWKVVQHEPGLAIHKGKQLGWACKLGGAETLGISKVGQTVSAN